eukprot:PhF_6_TR8271/c0_g1_i4/m.12624/K10597/UBE4B, UFD2; ubiquitin conjugation factor E4 B
MESFATLLDQGFSPKWRNDFTQYLSDCDIPTTNVFSTFEFAEIALVCAIETVDTTKLDLATQLVFLYNQLEGVKGPCQDLVVRYLGLHINANVWEVPPTITKGYVSQGGMRLLALLVPSRDNSESILNTTLSDKLLMDLTATLPRPEHTFRRLFTFLSSAISSGTGVASSRCVEGFLRLLKPCGQTSIVTQMGPEVFSQAPPSGFSMSHTHLARFLSFSLDANSVTILPDNQLFQNQMVGLEKLNKALHFVFKMAGDYGYKAVRTLLSVDKQGTCHWFDVFHTVNAAWSKENFDPYSVAKPGLLMNTANVVMQLVEPLYTDDATQLPRLAITEWYSPSCIITNPNKTASNTTPESPALHVVANLFFLGVKYFGLCAAIVHKSEKMLPALERQYREMRTAGQEENTPNFLGLYQMQRLYLTTTSLLLAPEMLTRLRGFAQYLMRWLFFVATGSTNSTTITSLPEDPPEHWSLVPQDLFSDIAEVLGFVFRVPSQSPSPTETISILKFITLFVTSTKYMTNKHHRSRYPLLLRQLLTTSRFSLGDELTSNVVSCILRCYVDLEALGEYKTESRHHLNCLLNLLWERSDVAKFLKQRVASMTEEFTKFVALLITDANHYLDSALETLKLIHTQQEEGNNTNLTELTNRVKGSIQFTDEALKFICTLCKAVPEALLQGLVTDQVACMLNYLLAQLAGPAMAEIRVSEHIMQDAGFKHRELVERIVLCYVGIARSSQSDRFLNSMCLDERSYNPTLFKEILSFLVAKNVVSDVRSELAEFFVRAERMFASREEDSALFEDPPDEFTCQITCVIMTDPIGLPNTPDIMVEAKAMYRHLLTEEFNPFNRQPLTAQQLTEYNNTPEMIAQREDMRRRIEEWKQSKREGGKK